MTIPILPRPGAFMLNPLEVEQRYQDLILLLSLPSTPFQRLSGMSAFLAFLGRAADTYESHVLECAERFPAHCAGLQAAGHAPHQLESIAAVMRETFRQVPPAHSVPGVEEGLRRLQVLCVLAYAYSGAWEDASRALGGDPSGGSLIVEREASFEDGLRLVEAALPSAAAVARATIAEVRREALVEAESQPHAVWLPVIEQASDESAPRTGSLRRVRATMFGDRAGGSDSITSDAAVFGAQHAGSSLADVPMKAVRGWLARQPGGHAERRYAGQVSLGGQYALHAGVSSDLAMAAVLACAILDLRAARVRYRLRPDVALTGVLDEDGTVRPVDAHSLALKVDAVFHSPAKVLVVPRAQVDDTEHAVRALQEHYPRRVLEIIGVRSFGDLFYDLRVIAPLQAPLAIHAMRWLWRRRSRTVAVVSSTVLLLLGGWYVLGRMDHQALRLEYEGDVLRVLNRYGAAVAEIDVGRSTVESWGQVGNPWDHTQGSAIGDADGDGFHEIFFVHSVSRGGGGADLISAYSVKEQRVLWTSTITPPSGFPDRADAKSGAFAVNDLVVEDVDADRRTEVFVAAHSVPTFPGLVVRFDPLTGAVRQTYVNTGHVSDIGVTDLDGDGAPELIMTGTNNAFNRAFLAVIGARAIDGCSPHTQEYRCVDPPAGKEKIYALLPRTILGATLGIDAKGNGGLFALIEASRGEIQVCVNDNIGDAVHPPVTVPAVLNFSFDRSLEPRGIATGDSYDNIAKWAVEQGLLARVPDQAYFSALARTVRIWRKGVEVQP